MRKRAADNVVTPVNLYPSNLWHLLTGLPRERRGKARRGRAGARWRQLAVEQMEPLVMLSGFSALGGSGPVAGDPLQVLSSPIILNTAGQVYQLQTSLQFTHGS